jgi:hypothetical protein
MINALHLGSGGGIAGNGTSISFGLGTGFDPTVIFLPKLAVFIQVEDTMVLLPSVHVVNITRCKSARTNENYFGQAT